MTLPVHSLAGMLNVTTSRAGVTSLMGYINAVGKFPEHVPVTLQNGGDGGVGFYRKLKAHAAVVMARGTDDESVIRYIASQEKRLTPQQALGSNPNIPADVVTQVQRAEDHQACTGVFLSLYTPLEDLLQQDRCPLWAWSRILAEATDEQLAAWLTPERQQDRNLARHCVFTRANAWETALRIVPLIEDPIVRTDSLITACVHEEAEVDWSLETWEPLFALVPEGDPHRPTHDRHPSPYMLGRDGNPAPAEWLIAALATATDPHFRMFALRVADPKVWTDPKVRESLSAGDFVQMTTNGFGAIRPEAIPAAASRVAADKALSEGCSRTAGKLMQLLDNRWPADIPQQTLEGLVLLAMQPEAPSHLHDAITAGVLLTLGRHGEPSAGFQDKFLGLLGKFPKSRAIANCVLTEDTRKLLATAHTPEANAFRERLLGLVPATIGSVPGSGEDSFDRMIVRMFEEYIPNPDETQWETLLTLAEDWDGTIPELIRVVEATS